MAQGGGLGLGILERFDLLREARGGDLAYIPPLWKYPASGLRAAT
jgi:hypothetical protein